ncbi:Heme-binding protein 2 [Halocaridina rubra]|uniref:Heme-binding protein 1 n=1 Tax=Halocaridina rubra TaxID=373956 RepID=A0AAN8XH17_HALRR
MRGGLGTLVILLIVSRASAGIWDSIVGGIGSALGYNEEAPYTVVRTYDNFVEREYPARKWVCTSATGASREEATSNSMFMKLFRYITGQNDRNEDIPMTVPVTTEYTHGNNRDNVYTMCFFIGDAHQANPPTPTEDSVFLQDRAAMTVYTRTVGGYMRSESQWMDEAARLAGFVQEKGISVSLTHMYWVGYDAPFKFWNRRNEVWFTS